MALNIVATRKLSLKGFAQGWDDCYLLIRGVGEDRRQEIAAALDGKEDKAKSAVLGELCKAVITGGVVINTNQDGTTEAVEITTADLPVLVNALNLAWQQEVLAVATGLDRLKVLI